MPGNRKSINKEEKRKKRLPLALSETFVGKSRLHKALSFQSHLQQNTIVAIIAIIVLKGVVVIIPHQSALVLCDAERVSLPPHKCDKLLSFCRRGCSLCGTSNPALL